MAVGQGFSKAVTSGSVFWYDTGDMINSFPGKFGTNILAGIIRNYNGAGQDTYSNGKLFRWNGYTETVNIPALGNRTVESVEIYNVYSGYGDDGNFNCCPSLFNYSNGWLNTPLSGSTVYMYEIVYKCESGYTNPNYMYHYEFRADNTYNTEFGVHDNSRRISLGDGWYYAWGEFTTQPTTAKGYFGLWYYYYNVPDKVSIASISLQQGNSILPPRQIIPTNTTRTTTQSLIDITGNYTIDTSNISYDSSGMLAFDGTNDYINVSPFSLNPNTNGFTYETILNSTITNTSYSTWKNLVGMGGGSNVYGILVEADTRGYRLDVPDTSGNRIGVTTGINIPANTNIHIVWSWENGVFKFYENGVLQVNSNQGAYSAPNITGIAFGTGINVSNGYWNGNQFVNKIYNRALTAGEVKQNYNHYKTRFNLT